MVSGHFEQILSLIPFKCMGSGVEVLWADLKGLVFYDAENMIHQENVVRVWVKAAYSEEGRLDEAGNETSKD